MKISRLVLVAIKTMTSQPKPPIGAFCLLPLENSAVSTRHTVTDQLPKNKDNLCDNLKKIEKEPKEPFETSQIPSTAFNLSTENNDALANTVSTSKGKCGIYDSAIIVSNYSELTTELQKDDSPNIDHITSSDEGPLHNAAEMGQCVEKDTGVNLLSLIMSGSAQSSVQKKTILPADLLKLVTENVRNMVNTDTTEMNADTKSTNTSADSCAGSGSVSSALCTGKSQSLLAEDSSILYISASQCHRLESQISISTSDMNSQCEGSGKESIDSLEKQQNNASLSCLDSSNTCLVNEISIRANKTVGLKSGKYEFDINQVSQDKANDNPDLICFKAFAECENEEKCDEPHKTTMHEFSTVEKPSDAGSDVDVCIKTEAGALMNIDISCDHGNVVKHEDQVYDLSLLFSGELEQRRKKLARRERRRLKLQQKRSKPKKSSDKQGTSEENEADAENKPPPKPVPNYFLAIQITNDKIRQLLEEVQRQMLSEESKLKPALIRPASLHITLMVLSLNSPDDILRSTAALDKAGKVLSSLYAGHSLVLDVAGLGHFRNEVVFAKLKSDDKIAELQTIVDQLEESFQGEGILPQDTRGFKPHITIAKMSKVKGSKKKGLKKIADSLYKDHVEREFGSEVVSCIQLCSMFKAKDSYGYYHVEHAVHFGNMDDDYSRKGRDNRRVFSEFEEIKKKPRRRCLSGTKSVSIERKQHKWKPDDPADWSLEGVVDLHLNSSDDDREEILEEMPQRPRTKPNYFIAIQIKNPQLREALATVQRSIVRQDPRLADAMTNMERLHITILVLSLEHQLQIEKCKKAMDKAAEHLQGSYRGFGLTLDVSGIWHFNHCILYAKIKHQSQISQLQRIHQVLSDCLLEEGIVTTDKRRRFKPHITIAKRHELEPSVQREVGLILPNRYHKFKKTDFGRVTVSSFQLCEMGSVDETPENWGYYIAWHTVQFVNPLSMPMTEGALGNENSEMLRCSNPTGNAHWTHAGANYKHSQPYNDGQNASNETNSSDKLDYSHIPNSASNDTKPNQKKTRNKKKNKNNVPSDCQKTLVVPSMETSTNTHPASTSDLPCSHMTSANNSVNTFIPRVLGKNKNKSTPSKSRPQSAPSVSRAMKSPSASLITDPETQGASAETANKPTTSIAGSKPVQAQSSKILNEGFFPGLSELSGAKDVSADYGNLGSSFLRYDDSNNTQTLNNVQNQPPYTFLQPDSRPNITESKELKENREKETPIPTSNIQSSVIIQNVPGASKLSLRNVDMGIPKPTVYKIKQKHRVKNLSLTTASVSSANVEQGVSTANSHHGTSEPPMVKPAVKKIDMVVPILLANQKTGNQKKKKTKSPNLTTTTESTTKIQPLSSTSAVKPKTPSSAVQTKKTTSVVEPKISTSKVQPKTATTVSQPKMATTCTYNVKQTSVNQLSESGIALAKLLAGDMENYRQ